MTETDRRSPKRRTRRDPARLPLRWACKSATREGEMYRRVARDLREQIGGNPTAAQELMIGRVAWLQVHLAKIDERAMNDGGLSPHATREYLAWANALRRMLTTLGLEATTRPQKTLAQHLASKAAAQPDDGGDD